MSKILLDTSVIIDFLRSSEKGSTPLYRLTAKKYPLMISIITHTELYAGKSVWETPKARQQLEIVFKTLSIIPLTENISTSAGRLRALNGLSLFDAIIAATALEQDATLATINIKDFKGISNLQFFDLR